MIVLGKIAGWLIWLVGLFYLLWIIGVDFPFASILVPFFAFWGALGPGLVAVGLMLLFVLLLLWTLS